MSVKKLFTNKILGIPIAVTNMRDAVAYVTEQLEELRGEYICFSNVHTTMLAYQDAAYKSAQTQAAVAFPDGSPLAYFLRRRHFSEAERIAGPDFMPALWQATENAGVSHFFYGSTQETIDALRENLQRSYPKLHIAGMISPPFRELTEAEDAEMVAKINASGADVVWVGLGAPKQELWMQRHRGEIHAVMLGVGAGFDFHAGTVKRAPIWLRTHYLEWLYRLFQDPKRLWKRYIVYNFRFLLLAGFETLHRERWQQSDKKRLLIYAHYYYPDVAATGQILMELAEGLLDMFEVTVICTVPSYTGKIATEYRRHKYYHEDINGVKVLRIRVPEFRKNFLVSRLYNIGSYFFSAISATTQVGGQDIVFAISQPPILGGLLGVIGKRLKKAKLVYNIQDFNPEQSRAVNVANSGLTYPLLRRIDTWTCKKADEVIVVGRDMLETLFGRLGIEQSQTGEKPQVPEASRGLPRYAFISNWVNEEVVYPIARNAVHWTSVAAFREKYGLMNKFVVMYSGNIGLYYDLKNLIRIFAEYEKRKNVVFAFVGEGSLLEELKAYRQEQGLSNIAFIPYQPKEALVYSLNAADVQIVVNARGIKGVSVPSKLYGVMAAGKPVLGVLEHGSEGARIMEEAGCGLLSEPGDYETFRKNLEFFLQFAEDESVKQTAVHALASETKHVAEIEERQAAKARLSENSLHEMGHKGREYLLRHLRMQDSIMKYRKEMLAL